MTQIKVKRNFFLKNKQGQVGLFVALIFQVIFVFFAMLVNVGLVVHHKINLQQSTDLAAYYGAMKQAEILNVIAHVNYQIRQSWKLFSWRYRILGSFGLESEASNKIEFPIAWLNPAPLANASIVQFNPNSQNFSCNAPAEVSGLTLADMPVMCLGHDGFADWISGPSGSSSRETWCRMDCARFGGAALAVPELKNITSDIGGLSGLTGQASAISQMINSTNSTIRNTCKQLAPITLNLLSVYYSNYLTDTSNKKNFIKSMMNNLINDEDKILDIEGSKVLTGVENTLKNNLTEANLNGDLKISTLNGVKGQTQLFNEITFQYLQMFVMYCDPASAAGVAAKVAMKSLFDESGQLRPEFVSQVTEAMSSDTASNLSNIFSMNNEKNNTIGFEKNPWIQVYYGVKATSEPRIPFLPLSRIKLSALSFAKPFGGSIGPWYVKRWAAGQTQSFAENYNERVDTNLPYIKINSGGGTSVTTLKGARELIPNYSNFLDDTFSHAGGDGLKGGLSNLQIVSAYHSMLAQKKIPNPNKNSTASNNKVTEPKSPYYVKPLNWPKYSEWFHLNKTPTDDDFDSLARSNDGGIKNSYMRDIEISVVAPNQFDLTYYSIEPNFYLAYVQDKLDKGYPKIKSATSTANGVAIPKDFGFIQPTSPVPGVAANFDVRKQLQLTYELFTSEQSALLSLQGVSIPNMFSGANANYAFTYVPRYPSSLLTSWTFKEFKDFNSFPEPISNSSTNSIYKMPFATCLDSWNPTYDTLVDAKYPAVPGNCISGGRTGYSVKIISSELVQSGKVFTNLGGEGTSGPILNPVSTDFLKF